MGILLKQKKFFLFLHYKIKSQISYKLEKYIKGVERDLKQSTKHNYLVILILHNSKV